LITKSREYLRRENKMEERRALTENERRSKENCREGDIQVYLIEHNNYIKRGGRHQNLSHTKYIKTFILKYLL
jgi:hypothetical protein